MFHKRETEIMVKLVQIVFLITVTWIMASCTSHQLPGDAEEALSAYWQSLPSYPSIEYQIIRSWRGVQPEEITSTSSEFEIWCVETTSIFQDGKSEPEPLIWIVVRQNPSDEWSVSLLMVMSSIWPYEACQVNLFDAQSTNHSIP